MAKNIKRSSSMIPYKIQHAHNFLYTPASSVAVTAVLDLAPGAIYSAIPCPLLLAPVLPRSGFSSALLTSSPQVRLPCRRYYTPFWNICIRRAYSSVAWRPQPDLRPSPPPPSLSRRPLPLPSLPPPSPATRPPAHLLQVLPPCRNLETSRQHTLLPLFSIITRRPTLSAWYPTVVLR